MDVEREDHYNKNLLECTISELLLGKCFCYILLDCIRLAVDIYVYLYNCDIHAGVY